jgi:hypothetical protein
MVFIANAGRVGSKTGASSRRFYALDAICFVILTASSKAAVA